MQLVELSSTIFGPLLHRMTVCIAATWLYWQRNPENRAYNIYTGPPQVADLSRAASSTELF
jgi:hypothetical protein